MGFCFGGLCLTVDCFRSSTTSIVQEDADAIEAESDVLYTDPQFRDDKPQ